ncbi:spermatogenesis-associated protein 1 isoform X2 [Melopsittacus undulatus]|uniref:spermatogenesis-associated protein 1 isoform X2 n=1 Tax=Melopsittacus undulatus TaxID=13146 RepID=UPI0012435EDA|nr:spermatogenesis-associated protein 1 isoform X2 [Melopsittacus undulatus]
MSFSQRRPQTSQLVEFHVFYVPEEVWNFKLNTVPVALTSKFISAGFIRVSPHITLRVLREKLGEYLGGVSAEDKFRFLKCIGKRLAVVKANQETELELKSFAPPYALYPELYLLPEVEYFEGVYPLSASTQQRRHFNAEANRLDHKSGLSSLPQQEPETSKQFLESIQSSHQLENKEVHNPVEWGEKEPVPVLNPNNKQDHNNRIQENHILLREDQNGFNGSLITPNHSNPADDLESGKSDMVLRTSQQNHLSKDQKENNTPKWNDEAKGTTLILHVNHSDEQGQNKQTPQNHIKYQKELTNMDNNDHLKHTKLRKHRTQDAGILKTVEDQATEYACKKQSLLQYRTSKSIAELGEKLDNQAGENKQNPLSCPKEYISPPNLPFLPFYVNPDQIPAIQTAENKMVEQLQQMKKDRMHMEKNREELIRKVKGLLEQYKLKRYHACEEWKKQYLETKKATVPLEDALNKLQQDLVLYHQKLLLQLEARDSPKRPNNTRNSKNYTIIQITTVQHELDLLRRKLGDTKMKLLIEIKMRKQAASDLRVLRAELTQKKINSILIRRSRK